MAYKQRKANTKKTPSQKQEAAAIAQQMFDTAMPYYFDGRLAEAERVFHQALVIDPRHAASAHFLGLIAYQTGDHVAAIKLIGRAISLRHNVPYYYNDLAVVLQSLGRLADAESHYKRALDLKPDYAEAHNNLSSALRANDKPMEAIVHSERALALKPDYAEAHANLASALQDEGRLSASVTHYERALALNPGSVQILNNLGNVLQSMGEFSGAEAQYRRALALKPDYAEGHSNLGNALLKQGRLDAAIMHYEHALAVRPAYPEVHNNLGSALQKRGRCGDAMMHYQRALAYKPDYPEAHTNMGNVLLWQGCPRQAIEHYQSALETKPDYAQAYHNIGIALQTMGVLADAKSAHEKAIDLAPQTAAFYRPLLNVKRVVPGDKHLTSMESLAEDMFRLPLNEQQELHFALGKAYSDIGDHQRSFHHFLAGNTLKRGEITYDEPAILGFFYRLRTVFTPELIRSKAGLGDHSATPVFIVGMPRSGTTLVEQILASHPQVVGAGERDDFMRTVHRLYTSDDPALEFPETIMTRPNETLQQLGSHYVAAMSEGRAHAKRIVDKTMGNFAYTGLIHMALPNARLIHIRRDPMDTCLSCFSTLFTAGWSPSYDLAELGRFYRAYATLMEHWQHALPDGAILEVCYEDLVDDFERQTRRIVAHCDIEWNDTCLHFYKSKRLVHTASVAQVRQDIYRTSVGRWRPYREFLQPLIHELGIGV